MDTAQQRMSRRAPPTFGSTLCRAHFGFGGAIRGADDLYELDAMAKSVDHRGDARGAFEDLVPLGEGFIGGRTVETSVSSR